MSNTGHFNGKHAHEEKRHRARFFEDLPAKQLRHADGSHAMYRGGKMVPGSHAPAGPVKETKNFAKSDVSTVESNFYKRTPISTLLEKTSTSGGSGERSGNNETAGEKEVVAQVRKPIDVNARRLKL